MHCKMLATRTCMAHIVHRRARYKAGISHKNSKTEANPGLAPSYHAAAIQPHRLLTASYGQAACEANRGPALS